MSAVYSLGSILAVGVALFGIWLWPEANQAAVHLGVRPFYLLDQMKASPLKEELSRCALELGEVKRSRFSIGHRGAPLQFPEHTESSYRAAHRLGAGVLECDVTFTQDLALVCRHSPCDLHETTNILSTPLAKSCEKPFSPYNSATGDQASARCCTHDISFKDYKGLCATMAQKNPYATTVKEYGDWPAGFPVSCEAPLSLEEAMELFETLGAHHTPELKKPEVAMPFRGMSQQDFARKLVQAFKKAHIAPERVRLQSFQWDDLMLWLSEEPDFGKRAIYLLEGTPKEIKKDLSTWKTSGIVTVAPPLFSLLKEEEGRLGPSAFSLEAQDLGLKLVTWTLERSLPLTAKNQWYYQGLEEALKTEGDVYELLLALKKAKVEQVFSDWPATVSFFDHCVEEGYVTL